VYVTQETAKKMFCPFINDKCKGSECMWWSWYIATPVRRGFLEFPEVQKDTDVGCCRK